MATFRFHLIGGPPIDLEITAPSIGDLALLMSQQRFIEGRMTQPDGDGVLAAVLIATSRIQCAVEV